MDSGIRAGRNRRVASSPGSRVLFRAQLGCCIGMPGWVIGDVVGPAAPQDPHPTGAEAGGRSGRFRKVRGAPIGGIQAVPARHLPNGGPSPCSIEAIPARGCRRRPDLRLPLDDLWGAYGERKASERGLTCPNVLAGALPGRISGAASTSWTVGRAGAREGNAPIRFLAAAVVRVLCLAGVAGT